MNGADDEYSGPPLPGGQSQQQQGNSQMRQGPYGSLSSSSLQPRQSHMLDQQVQMAQMAAEVEQELYLRRQIEIQRDIELRRRLIQEQHQQFVSELENQQMQQLTQSPLASQLLQQQRLLELQQFGSPNGRPFGLTNEEMFLQAHGQNILNNEAALSIMRQELLAQQQQQQQQVAAIQRDLEIPEIGVAGVASQATIQARGLKEEEKKKADSVAKSSVSNQSQKVKESPKASTISPETVNGNEKRKCSDSGLSKSARQKKGRSKSKDDGEDGESKSKSPSKSQKDIALLLRATKDPSVKDFLTYRRELANEAVEMEAPVSKSRSTHDNGKGKKQARPSGDENGASDLDALVFTALEAENGTRMKAPNISDREIASLFYSLQGQSPKGIDRAEGENKEDGTASGAPHYMSSLPLLPIEPEYAEIENAEGSDSHDELPSQVVDEKSSNPNDVIVSSTTIAPLTPMRGIALPGAEERAVKEPVLLKRKDEENQAVIYTTAVDTWWPSNNTIRRERRIQGYRSDEEVDKYEWDKTANQSTSENTIAAIRGRLENDVEPGVIQKLPHCKLHRFRSKKESKGCAQNHEPLFCVQVTESHCTDVMVCCSVCSTWRHAACGGHHTRYSAKNNSDTPFKAICDRCYEEETMLRDYPSAMSRMGRQRTEHLRKSLATSSVIRQAAFAKHGGQYKWPLGSVSSTHIGGHTRSVQIRHERAEKQWSDMAAKLGSGVGYRPKERLKVRIRELERLLGSVEDAEGYTDRHNMTLFLLRDIKKESPAGFEKPRHNFFDLEEDAVPDEGTGTGETQRDFGSAQGGPEGDADDEESVSSDDSSLPGKIIGKPLDSNIEQVNVGTSAAPVSALNGDVASAKPNSTDLYRSQVSDEGTLFPTDSGTIKSDEKDASSVMSISSNDYPSDESEVEDGSKCANNGKGKVSRVKPRQCARVGCFKKQRFDSVFCSDGCGVAAVELDILNSLEFSNDIHPSLLR